MKLVNINAEGATIQLEETELRMAMALIQEGRLAFECDSPTGSDLNELFKFAAKLVCRARITGQKIASVHRKCS